MKKIILVLCVMLMVVSGCGSTKDNSGRLTEIYNKVKEAYGENYLPSMTFEKEYLTEVMGVPEADIKEFIAEGPMMSAHVDMFVGIEAVDGKAQEVESALQTYLEGQQQNMMMYPMNVSKVAAAKVVRVDNYVFYLCLGGYVDDETLDDTAQQTYYEQQNEIAEKIIKDILGK